VEEFKPGLLRHLGYESDDLWWQQLSRPDAQPQPARPQPPQASEIGPLKSQIAGLEARLQVAESAAKERLTGMETLQQVAEERLQLIHSLQQTAEERLELALRHEQIANEHLRTIERLGKHG